MKDILEQRKINFFKLLDIHFAGNAAAWERAGEKRNRQHASQWKKGVRTISEESARKIEADFGLLPGALDREDMLADTLATDETHVFIPQLDVAVCAGDGRINEEHVQVSGELAFKRSWLTKRGLSAANLRALTCEGLSMLPYLADGDTMLVDITAIEPKHGDVMVLCEGELTQVKRLVRVVDGWLLTSDNPDKTTYRDRPLETTHKIIGRVVWRAG